MVSRAGRLVEIVVAVMEVMEEEVAVEVMEKVGVVEEVRRGVQVCCGVLHFLCRCWWHS